MAVSAVVSYFCGRLIHRFADKKGLKRLWLILSVVANMAVLLVFIRSGHSSYDVTSLFTGKSFFLCGERAFSLSMASPTAWIFIGKK